MIFPVLASVGLSVLALMDFTHFLALTLSWFGFVEDIGFGFYWILVFGSSGYHGLDIVYAF
jgi:hypothetical protein